jgi:hypothetical protein
VSPTTIIARTGFKSSLVAGKRYFTGFFGRARYYPSIILAGFSARANQLAKPVNEVAPCRSKKETHEIAGGIAAVRYPGSL